MLIGLYGGTFDPVHLGHLNVAIAVKQYLGLDEVRLVLNAQPAHKQAECVSAEHRWAMLNSACANRAGLVADNTELLRGGRSYTIDTLRTVQQQNPNAILCWIVGEDSFATLPSWHRWQAMLDYCNFVVLNRPGQAVGWPLQLTALYNERRCLQLDPSHSGQVLKLDLPMLEISSTEIRQRIASGWCCGDMIDADVDEYIRDNRLYTSHSATRETPI